ncbi:hypothetical protein [Nocardia sp. CNY236]|uniref:hypothetical protein n=1 Tax=Nocardia sp. CNY236 TaxID=1169152 RepID=UPI00041C85D5|nr:hypothetical protein [Nocardia sp. CNY236]
MTVLELSDEWQVRDDSGSSPEDFFPAALREIKLELSPDHELSGQVVRIEARYWPADDVIVSLIDGEFALIHPTWSGHVELPPWPKAFRLGYAVMASRAISEWEQWH